MSLSSVPWRQSIVLGLSFLALASTVASNYFRGARRYPVTRQGSEHRLFTSRLLGPVSVPTPYSWLEDPEAEETKRWVEAQNKVTEEHLKKCTDKESLEQELTAWNNFEKHSCPFKRGNKVFHFFNSGLENHAKLLVRNELDGKDEVLLDPNTWSVDGTTSLGSFAFTKTGEKLAYGISKFGSDWVTIYVQDVNSKTTLTDKIEWVKFSGISWDKEGKGFFYSRYPAPHESDDETKLGSKDVGAYENHALYYHKLGTTQSSDSLIYDSPENPKWMFGGEVSEDGKYLIITVSDGCDPVNRLFLLNLSNFDFASSRVDPKLILKIVDNFDASYDYITNRGSVFFFKTNLKAPNSKLVSIDIDTSDATKDFTQLMNVILPESQAVLEGAYCVAHSKFVVLTLENVQHVLSLYDFNNLETRLIKKFDLPCPGNIGGIGAREEDDDFFFSFTSFIYPNLIFHTKLDVSGNAEQRVWLEVKANNLDSSSFKVEQQFYKSKDGTSIPLFVISRKDLVLNGNAPTILYGYGGFNISLLPSFAASRLLWVKKYGGVYAIANLRGGGEFGTAWHDAGKLFNKQNVFDDFQYAAKHLISAGVTRPEKLAINGGSNGGLLVGACINQAPELYGAAVAQVGVMDMLSFHRLTIGSAWCTDYGNAETDPEMFDYLFKYSPIHNVNTTKPYPSVLLTTADHGNINLYCI